MGTLVKQKHGGSLYRPAKGERLNPKGRPCKTVGQINAWLESIGSEPATLSQIIYQQLSLVNLSLSQLKDIANDETANAHSRGMARQLVKDPYGTIQDILDRGHGRPTQKVDARHSVKEEGATLSPKQLKQLEQLLTLRGKNAASKTNSKKRGG